MGKYGSDLIVDALRAHGIRYVPLNPGASYRGLHDSLVNYATDGPGLIVCTNEKIAVNMAHGYAKATGEPLAAVVHDVVGLMQGTMGLYTAYVDRVPALVLGGTGPMAVGKRRPHIEWVHTALTQGELVRNFVKWDDQPFDPEGIVDGFARGYQIATTEPRGPVYLCYDLGLQEEQLAAEPPPVVHRRNPPQQFPADEAVASEIAALLAGAERPVIVAGRVGRHRQAVPHLARLAESCAAPVYDLDWRFNLPNVHPLHFLDKRVLDGADVVLALDVADLYGALTAGPAGEGRQRRFLPAPGARIAEIRLDLLEGNGWLPVAQKYQPVDLSVLANTALALPMLAEAVDRTGAARGGRIAARREHWEREHHETRRRDSQRARAGWDDRPVATARLAAELWAVLQDARVEWTVTGSTLNGWIRRLWDFGDWSQHLGRPLGTATQIGTSMGVALAHRDSGRIVVAVQPDGDLLFDLGALWTIAAHRLPMLVVMFNNRAYFNDWEHQENVARDRGRDPSRAHIGMDLTGPAPDFATLARGFGWFALGPIDEPRAVRGSLERALAHVVATGEPALVDVVTQHR